MIYRDRDHAGDALGELLVDIPADAVLALPRGGVPVAARVAARLDLPLDVFVVRKLGVPGHEELAFGAVASGGARVLNDDVVRIAGLDEQAIDRVTRRATTDLLRQEAAYRGDRSPLAIDGARVIVVDDGLATGASMRVAVAALTQQGAARVTVAVPVGPAPTCDALRLVVDAVVCAFTPDPFEAVGRWYRDFDQVSDRTVRRLLAGEVRA